MVKIMELMKTAFFLFLILLLVGCGKEPETKKTAPAVNKVTKKINIPKGMEKKIVIKKDKPIKKKIKSKTRKKNKKLLKNKRAKEKRIENQVIEKIAENNFFDEGPDLKGKSSYDPQGRIDPFSPLVKNTPKRVVRKKKKRTRPKTPLEKLDLGQLQLKAVLESPQGKSAVIEEASGKGYIVGIGTFIGLNSGEIVRIELNEVIIRETIEDISGKSITRMNSLKIQKPVGE